MVRPSVNITLMNGGLGINAVQEFGTVALMVATAVAPVAGYATPFLLRNDQDAKTAFAQVGNEAIVEALVNGFYGEANPGSKLYVIAFPQSTTLAEMADPTKTEPALVMAAGQIRIVAYGIQHANGYTPTVTNALDEDVDACVVAAQTLATSWLVNKKRPFRFFVQGTCYSGVANNLKDYSTTNYRNGHIILGTINGSELFALCLALGRAAFVDAQQNIGRILNGSLNIADTYSVLIGTTTPENAVDSDLDTIYERRYITFEKNQIAAGYVWNDDNSLVLPTDDYNNLRNGRVIDNAVRIVFNTYYLQLKDDVEEDANGRMGAIVEKALESSIVKAIDDNMRSQLSTTKEGFADVICLVNPDPTTYAGYYSNNNIESPDFNLNDGGNVYIFLSLRPKGCLKQINCFVGFTS